MIATMRNPKDAFVSYFHHQIRKLGTIDDAEKKALWPEYFNWLIRHKRGYFSHYFYNYPTFGIRDRALKSYIRQEHSFVVPYKLDVFIQLHSLYICG